MLITHTSIKHMTQASFLFSVQTLSTWLICTVIYWIGKNKNKLSKTKLKNSLNFLDKCLILHCLFKIKGVKVMFGAGTKASFANYFQKGKIQFSQCTVKLIYTRFGKLFILVFVTKLSKFLAIIDGYYNCLFSDWTIWYNLTRLKDLLSNMLILLLYNTFHRWPCQTIHKSFGHRMLDCYPILFTDKTIRTLT